MQIIYIVVKIQVYDCCQEKLKDKDVNSSEPSSYVVRSLVDAFSNIGKKSRSNYRNAARHVLSQSIMKKRTKPLQLLKPTSKLVGLDIKTLCRYFYRIEQLDSSQTNVSDCIGRLPSFDMKLIDALKGLVQEFRHDNSRPSSNQKDVLKLRRGSTDHKPHIKIFIDMTKK